ncbi:hypothetical protein 9F4_17 [uncultured Caudovirales phage]|uniref:Uncharacterized protein n=2 Tax=root TaxID=1 RepID=A0A2H4JEI9_9CAUD|nr:hypothetical protein 9F4_17 [uncultured Caudovirales phage]
MSDQQIVEAVENGDLLLVDAAPFSPLSDDNLGRYAHITGQGRPGSSHSPVEREREPLPVSKPEFRQPLQEPGFYVVRKSTTVDQLKAALFSSQYPAVMSKFDALNPGLSTVNAGSMIVLSDPNNLQCTREEAILMAAAAKANEAVKALSPEEADFMARHRDEIETVIARGATAIGIGEAMFAKNLDDVRKLFKEVEALHIRSFQTDGHLRSPAFFAERRRLLAQLNTNLTTLTRKSIGFPDHPNLKSALGISSRSLVHHWTLAGGADQIPGYATHIDSVSKASKYLKLGGWIGTGIGGGASYMKVQDVCSAGNTEACKRIKFTEAGSFLGGAAGGAVAGAVLTGSTVGYVCFAIGVPTGGVGTLICGVAVVGVASFASGAIGGVIGEETGDVIYEIVK